MNKFRFEIIHTSKKSRARIGKIYTPHGIIETPNFVPVATNGALKAIDTALIEDGVQLLFCNTYHLLLQPGMNVIAQAGGLHQFMGRTKPIITDSGGFQVFSLMYGTVKDELKSSGKKITENAILKITEEGVLFRSYLNGLPVLMTPESSIQAQKILGADIIIPFDELLPYHAHEQRLKTSLDRTHRWEERSLQEHRKQSNNQAIYAVIHGGVDNALRAHSCNILTALPFDGFAIGGSLGKTKEEMINMLSELMPRIAPEFPTHLLGIGDLASIAQSIPLGIDTFDSSHPTRCARHGMLLDSPNTIKIMNSCYTNDFRPISENCLCYTCKHYSRAYLKHLFKAHELSAYSLASIHNIHFMMELMKQYRIMIAKDLI